MYFQNFAYFTCKYYKHTFYAQKFKKQNLVLNKLTKAILEYFHPLKRIKVIESVI